MDIQNGGIGDRVLGNRIFANAGLTIDLGLDGPTPNDPGDGDANASTAAGANNLQNFPVLASAADDGTRLAVTGTLNSLPNTAFRVELFRSIACHATGFGDAAQPIGAVTARTDAAGNAAFSSALASVPAGSVLTATATDPAGNTSEASACLPVSRTGAPVVGGAPVAPIPSAPAPAPVASAPSAPPAPVLHRSVAVAPESGTVLVRRPGASRFTPVEAGALVPLGSALDVSVGRVSLTAARDTAGATQTASFYGGRFVVGQPGGPRPLTELRLDGPSCSSPRGSARIAAVTRKKKRKRSLWGDGKGHFRTRGRSGTATVQGTKWLTEDSCAGTLVRVARGAVAVRDLLRRRTVTVKAGRSYLARARR